MNISYAITVCNEDKELESLLNLLHNHITEEDEIIILSDLHNTAKEVLDIIQFYSENYNLVKHFKRSLNKDFASQKNFLFDLCEKDYIFNIDADELPNVYLLENIKSILDKNNTVELFILPRVNIVNGITKEYITKMRWNVNEKGWINWPDSQQRISKNNDKIRWNGKVHERLIGYNNVANFPLDEKFCLYHIKEFKKQIEQNNFYSTIK
jgi:hypothetical protein